MKVSIFDVTPNDVRENMMRILIRNFWQHSHTGWQRIAKPADQKHKRPSRGFVVVFQCVSCAFLCYSGIVSPSCNFYQEFVPHFQPSKIVVTVYSWCCTPASFPIAFCVII